MGDGNSGILLRGPTKSFQLNKVREEGVSEGEFHALKHVAVRFVVCLAKIA